ncbi:hypothetical protein PVAP13_3NG194300 [Panicum virgatum]|uniref:Uncharacterized protein n=1 Tax=Panicum virgatum TaxID=38727 RepID=A0A8T0UFJ1_PANVG|nr:hypothetical protein PVAP13_3NG194300 [Panicum virgatum]KAG2620828.1 hypothetical protein PVAP13_3NG194300 [Panicum virgatum]
MFLAVYLCATTASESDYVLVVLHQTPARVPPDSSKSASGTSPYEDRELEEKVVIETKSSINSYRKKRIPIGWPAVFQ